MAEVLLANEELTVLGGPSSVSVDVGIGATGDRGSITYAVSADPRLATTTKPSDIKVYDIAIVINPSESDYRVMYQKTGPGSEDWSELIDLNLTETQTKTVKNISDDYTLLASDRFSIIRSTASTAISITIDDVLSIGESIQVIQDGTGVVSFAVGSGANVIAKDWANKAISDQYGLVEIVCVAEGEYRVIGDIS